MTGGGDIKDESKKTGIPVAFLEDSERFRDVYVYPDNWPIVQLFMDIQTQWRVGPGGVLGLDYNALQIVFGLRRVKRSEREEIFEGVQIMESAALAAIREQNGA